MAEKETKASTETQQNIYQRINAVMAELGPVEKTGNNSFHKYNFIEQSVLLAKLNPLFVKHGLVLLPEITNTQYRKDGAIAQCDMQFTLVNADKPDEKIGPLPWSAEGEDKGDKAVNKAGTSGQKYFLMKLFMVSDKDDPDAESPTQTSDRKGAPEPQKKTAQRRENPFDIRKEVAEEVKARQDSTESGASPDEMTDFEQNIKIAPTLKELSLVSANIKRLLADGIVSKTQFDQLVTVGQARQKELLETETEGLR